MLPYSAQNGRIFYVGVSFLGGQSPINIIRHIKFSYTGDTGISVNAYDGGRAIVAIGSGNNDAGDYTYCAIYLLRCGYNGNNLTSVLVAESRGGNYGSMSFSVSSNGTLVLNSSSLAETRFLLLSNKPF